MFPPSRASNTVSEDAAVRSTDSDALLSRVSAARQGYLIDSFSPLFLTPSQRRSTERRPPLINIGTHARTWAVDELVEQFLRSGGTRGKGPLQVLSLGAGTDTRYWRMRKRWNDRQGEESWPCRKWVEIDFAEATGTKARTIATKAELKSELGGDVKIGKLALARSASLELTFEESRRTRRTRFELSSLRCSPRRPSRRAGVVRLSTLTIFFGTLPRAFSANSPAPRMRSRLSRSR